MSIDYNKRPQPGSEPPAGGDSGSSSGGIDYTRKRASPPATPPPAPADFTKQAPPAPADFTKQAPPPATGPVSLTKRGQSVSLTKGGGAIRINLNWNQSAPQPGGGGFMRKMTGGGGSGGIDLDLGCLIELSDGRKTAVQALGTMFGDLDKAPWIKLDKDDRSGAVSEGENLFISGDHSAQIKRIAVFAFIYEGAPNWSTAGGIVTIHQPQGAPITIALDETRDGARMCAICIIEGGPSGYTVRREVQYVGGHRELDELYGWGMDWVRGSK